MEQDLNHVKVVLHNLLTKASGYTTIERILKHYIDSEGIPVPFKQLGFNTVYELLKYLNDVFEVPDNANENSPIKLIIHEETSNVSHQNYLNNNNFKVRGYDYIKTPSCNMHRPKGHVTKELQTFIEDLCLKHPQGLHIPKFKHTLISHADFIKLQTNNLEQAINMFKYFIRIKKNYIYLKDAHKQQLFKNAIQDTYIIDEMEELSISYDDVDELLVKNFLLDTNYEELIDFTNLQAKTKDNFLFQNKSEKISKPLTLLNTESKIKFNIKPNAKTIIKKQMNIGQDPIKIKVIDDKINLTFIIKNSTSPITVQKALQKFKNKYGYDFPLQKYKSATPMNFFRLNSQIFKLEKQFTTNSIVKVVEESTIPEQTHSVRTSLLQHRPIYKNKDIQEPEKKDLIKESEKLEPNTSNYNLQPYECIKHTHTSIDQMEKYDSDMIEKSMKEELKTFLNKYKHGIKYEEFMDLYSNECHRRFSFYDYGFRSMKDMAYNLPSVFFVNDSDEGDNCILYHSSKRDEFNKTLTNVTETYKKIPKFIIHNLSILFDDNQSMISFDDLKTLYSNKFGRLYEPLKYGFSSEKQMFMSLKKMIRIKDSMVLPIDPYAYKFYFDNTEVPININENNSPILLNFIGNDLIDEKLNYSRFQLNTGFEQLTDVVVTKFNNSNSLYIQLVSKNNCLMDLMNSLQYLYTNNNDEDKVLTELIIPGMPCVSKLNTKWYRSIVLKLINDNILQVLCVDYGTVVEVSKSNIRSLKLMFRFIPVQALHCSLFQCNEMINLSQEVNNIFTKMVEKINFQAKFEEEFSHTTAVTLYYNAIGGKININHNLAETVKSLPATCINKKTMKKRMAKILK